MLQFQMGEAQKCVAELDVDEVGATYYLKFTSKKKSDMRRKHMRYVKLPAFVKKVNL